MEAFKQRKRTDYFKGENDKMTDIRGLPETQFLIVSYSYSGNTHQIAKGIQEATGGDRCEIYPRQPYPMAFPELLKCSSVSLGQ